MGWARMRVDREFLVARLGLPADTVVASLAGDRFVEFFVAHEDLPEAEDGFPVLIAPRWRQEPEGPVFVDWGEDPLPNPPPGGEGKEVE